MKESIETHIGVVSTEFVNGLLDNGLISQAEAKNVTAIDFALRRPYMLTVLAKKWDKVRELGAFLELTDKKKASRIFHDIANEVVKRREQQVEGKH